MTVEKRVINTIKSLKREREGLKHRQDLQYDIMWHDSLKKDITAKIKLLESLLV